AAGQVVGTRGNIYGWGFLWTPTTPNGTVGDFADLPPLPDSPFSSAPDSFSQAAGINDAGQVVGFSRWYDNPEEGNFGMLDRAVVWPDGAPRDLNREAFDVFWSWKLSSAAAINDAGQIVGQTDDRHAFLLTPLPASPGASSFVVSGFPSPTTAGTAGSFTVTTQLADGTTATDYTGTVHLSSSDAQAGLPADYTFTTADQGVHTFGAILRTA